MTRLFMVPTVERGMNSAVAAVSGAKTPEIVDAQRFLPFGQTKDPLMSSLSPGEINRRKVAEILSRRTGGRAAGVSAMKQGSEARVPEAHPVSLPMSQGGDRAVAGPEYSPTSWLEKVPELPITGGAAIQGEHDVAGLYEDASEAYRREDFTTAIRLCRPLAEKGHAGAQ